jgi:pyruvate,orthophosphate dikinase
LTGTSQRPQGVHHGQLGGKGANLADMAQLGVPVPAGFTVTTEVCTAYYDNKGRIPKNVTDEYVAALKKVEKVMGKKFGDEKNPLLLSVRSGARMSMPGMMDTVLNIGLCTEDAPRPARSPPATNASSMTRTAA